MKVDKDLHWVAPEQLFIFAELRNSSLAVKSRSDTPY